MSISYFCNSCENEDDFVISEGSIHCKQCNSTDVEMTRDSFLDEDDIYHDPFEDIDSLFD
jgi:hypothetical protein